MARQAEPGWMDVAARSMRFILAACLVSLPVAWRSAAAAQVNVEGVSGLIDVPTAEVVSEGSAVFAMGRYLRRATDRTNNAIARTYTVTVGYLPRLEVVARFADYPGLPDTQGATNYMDRSVSLKYQLYHDEEWSFAIGTLDLGGQSIGNQAYYGVATYTAVPKVSLSVGAGTDRFSGVFGGVRYAPLPWLSVLGEYDTAKLGYGLEVRPLKGLALKAGISNGHGAFSGSYSVPLDPRGTAGVCGGVDIPRCAEEYADALSQACSVRDALAGESFENVVVGAGDGTLFVEYESRRFLAQMDAMGVAATLCAQRAGADASRLVLTPKIDDVPQLSVQVDVEELRAFLADPAADSACFRVAPYCTGGYPPGTTFAGEANRKVGGGQATLRPANGFEITRRGEPTFQTKNGFGLMEEAYVGRGLKVQARQDWPLMNDIEVEGEKTDPVMRDAYASYFAAFDPRTFVQITGGFYGSTRYGGSGEVRRYLDGERFRLGGRYSLSRRRGNFGGQVAESAALAEASWYDSTHDLEVSVLGGQFLAADRGLRLESTRYFGPTTLTFFAYDTNRSPVHGGFQVFVPLPWYSEGRHGHWRTGSAAYFPYQYRTDSSGWGEVGPPSTDLAQTQRRLDPAYVRAHLDELRRAAVLFLGQG